MESISCVVAAFIGFALSAVSGKFLIPFLQRIKFGQTIKEIGPTWHKNKQGTPTMGGFMFYLGTVLGVVAGLVILFLVNRSYEMELLEKARLFGGLGLALCFGFIGFLDDYINGDTYFKIRREKHNLERARCQLTLAKDMDAKQDEMQRIVHAVVEQSKIK
jgi:UDP-N-acetylmuramyl pentapeptide phosphotransferase/UDP-N-acetylglucosamine-1-phosphate transferase